MFELKNTGYSVSYERNDDAGDEHAYYDREKCLFEAYPEEIGDQRTGPRAGAGERYRDKKRKPEERKVLALFRFDLCAAFCPKRHSASEPETLQPAYYLFDKKQYERRGEQIPDNGYAEGLPERQSEQTPERYRAAKLDDRYHRAEKHGELRRERFGKKGFNCFDQDSTSRFLSDVDSGFAKHEHDRFEQQSGNNGVDAEFDQIERNDREGQQRYDYRTRHSGIYRREDIVHRNHDRGRDKHGGAEAYDRIEQRFSAP